MESTQTQSVTQSPSPNCWTSIPASQYVMSLNLAYFQRQKNLSFISQTNESDLSSQSHQTLLEKNQKSQIIQDQQISQNKQQKKDLFLNMTLVFWYFSSFPLTRSNSKILLNILFVILLFPTINAVSCPAFCSNCNTTNGVCLACFNTYGVYFNGGICSSCSAAIPQCLTCTSSTKCVQCASTFYVNNITKCTFCNDTIPFCKICSSSKICSICIDNTVALAPNHLSCPKCSTILYGCRRCNYTYCFQCLLGYFMGNASINNNTTNTTNNSTTPININSTPICIYCKQNISDCILCYNTSYCYQCTSLTHFLETDHFCYPCYSKFPNCQYCTYFACNFCQVDFYLSLKKQCQCKKGILVGNFCSTIIGCTSTQFFKNQTVCKDCAAQFYFDISNLDCKCKQGFVLQGKCSLLYGCLVSSKNSHGLEQCQMCSPEGNIFMNNGVCSCNTGYILNTSRNCIEICGDGKLFQIECDDGNTRNGDGCSSICKVQQFFICEGGTPTSLSHCVYQGKKISLQLYKMYKKIEQNTGVFIFKIKNNIPFLNLINFSTFTRFNTSPISNLVSVNYDRGKLFLYVNYKQDLQGLEAQISLLFGSDYFFVAQEIKYSFIMISETSPLVVLAYPSEQLLFILQLVLIIITLIAFFILIIGSFFHKMIGLQTINVLQICYFLPFTLTDSSIILQKMRFLELSTGFGKSLFFDYQNQKYLPDIFKSMEMPKQFWEITGLTFGYLLGAILIFIGLAMISSFNSVKTKKYPINRKIASFFYHRTIFPISMALLSLTILSLSFNNLRVYEWQERDLIKQTTLQYQTLPLQFNSIIILIVIFIISLIFSIEVIHSFKDHRSISLEIVGIQYHPNRLLDSYPDFTSFHNLYLGIYLCKMAFGFFVLNSLIFLQNKFSSIFIYTIYQLIYGMCLLFYRPYQSILHNSGIIIGQFIIILYCSGLGIKQFYLIQHLTLQPIYQMMFCCTIILLLGIFELFSLIRIGLEYFNKVQYNQKREQFYYEKNKKIKKQKKRSRYDYVETEFNHIRQEMNKFPNIIRNIPQNQQLKRLKTRLKVNLSEFTIKEKCKKITMLDEIFIK